MVWILIGYIFISIAFAVTGGMKAGLGVAFYTLATSGLLVIAGARLQQILWYEMPHARKPVEKDGVTAGILVAITAAGLAQWLSGGFSIQVFGAHFSGWVWGWLGFAVGFANGPWLRTDRINSQSKL